MNRDYFKNNNLEKNLFFKKIWPFPTVRLGASWNHWFAPPILQILDKDPPTFTSLISLYTPLFYYIIIIMMHISGILKGLCKKRNFKLPSLQRWQWPIQTVTVKALSEYVWIRYQCVCFFKLVISICSFSAKSTCEFLANKKQWRYSQK